MITNLTTIILIAYIAVIIFFSYTAYRQTKTSEDYLLAGKEINPIVMAISYGATFISTSAIVGFGGVAAQLGLGILWLVALNIFVGIFIAFVFFGKRTRQIGQNLGAFTFPEFLAKRFDSKFIQIFSAAIIFIAMPIYSAAVLRGGAEFVKEFFKIPFDVALFSFVLIVAAYVILGGLKGVIYTDAFQGAIMFAGMIYLCFSVYSELGGVMSAHHQLTDLFNSPVVREQTMNIVKGGFQGWTSMPEFGSAIWLSLVTSIIAGVGIGVLAQPQLVVRFMTVKNNRDLNRALVSGSIFILVLTGAAYMVGALSNVIFFRDTGFVPAALMSVDSIIPYFINTYTPSWFVPVFFLTLLSAAMSTLSAQFHTMGISLGYDLYQKGFAGKKNSLIMNKAGVLVTVFISALIAYGSSFLEISTGIIAAGTALFMGLCAAAFLPAYLVALFSKSAPRAAAIASILSGTIMSLFWMFFIHAKNAANLQLCKLLTGKANLVAGTSLEYLSLIDSIMISLPLSITVLLIVWAYYKFNGKTDISKEHIEKCFKGI